MVYSKQLQRLMASLLGATHHVTIRNSGPLCVQSSNAASGVAG